MQVFSRWRIGAPLLMVLLRSPSAAAQQPAPANGAPPSTEGNRLQIGFLLQTDGRFMPGDADDQYADTFTFRRVRPMLQGTVGGIFDFQFTPDFAGASLAARAFTVGANWYVNQHVKWVFNIERTALECIRGGSGCVEHLVGVRQQLNV